MTRMNKRTEAAFQVTATITGSVPTTAQDLRQRAEAIAGEAEMPLPENLEQLSPGAIRTIVHELHVHQIQLEMQNEELRRTQTELNAARARYFDLYDLAPMGYCTLSVKGLILEANFKVATLLGMTRGALINQPFVRFIFKEDLDLYYLHRQQDYGTGTPQLCELRMMKQDGAPFWCHLATTLTQAGDASEYRMVICDITMRKQTEEALCKREGEFRRIMETAREGIGVTDKNWRITFVNNQMAELLGYAPREMVGRPLEDFVFAEDKEHCTQRMREREQGQDGYHECRFLGKDGTKIWATVSATAQIDRDGKFTGSFFMLTDITERKEAEASSKAKSDFLALISHEIRTPLNTLVGFSSLARKINDPIVLQQYLDIIDQSSRSLMDLVNDILDMSKIESGQLHLESISFNPADTIDLLVWQYGPLAKQKNLDFQVTKATDLPVWMSGDPIRLRQVLANLIANAIKFTESGNITLTISAMVSSSDKDCVTLRFKVQDTGIGITQDNLALLFQPFWQIDPSITRKYGGTGLGLAIVRSLVQLMCGRIEVTSEEGRGSCFVVELPFRVCRPPLYNEVATPVIDPLAILVVEDNAFNRLYLTERLTLWGHAVTPAESAFQALELTARHRYDLIILDVRMPDMDGIELTRRLRRREKEHHARPVRIIACTGDAERATKERCLAAGIQAVLYKPLNPDKLAQAITGQKAASVEINTQTSSCRITDRVMADMGYDSAKIEEYLQLLSDDIRCDLKRLDQAMDMDDRMTLKTAAHTLKGLCGHLQNTFPAEVAQRLYDEALTSSHRDLQVMVTLMRSICTQLIEGLTREK